MTQRRESIGGGAVGRGPDLEIIDLSPGADVKDNGLAANQRKRFHLMKVLAEFTKQKRLAAYRHRQVLTLVCAQHHDAAGRRTRSSFLHREQVSCFEQSGDRMQRMSSRHSFLRAQGSVGEKRKRSIAKQHRYVSAIRGGHFFTVTKAEQRSEERRVGKEC